MAFSDSERLNDLPIDRLRSTVPIPLSSLPLRQVLVNQLARVSMCHIYTRGSNYHMSTSHSWMSIARCLCQSPRVVFRIVDLVTPQSIHTIDRCYSIRVFSLLWVASLRWSNSKHCFYRWLRRALFLIVDLLLSMVLITHLHLLRTWSSTDSNICCWSSQDVWSRFLLGVKLTAIKLNPCSISFVDFLPTKGLDSSL